MWSINRSPFLFHIGRLKLKINIRGEGLYSPPLIEERMCFIGGMRASLPTGKYEINHSIHKK
jgi:hypothetical protein